MEPVSQLATGASPGRAGRWLARFPLLQHGMHRVSGWAHIGAAVPPFSADFVKPAAPLCTLWVLIAAAAAAAGLLIAVRLRKLAAETAAAIVVFCLMVAFYTLIVIGLQKLTGDPHGAVSHAVPGVEELQQRLGLIGAKVEAIDKRTAEMQQAQGAEARRAETRHRELIERQKESEKRLERLYVDASGGGAAAVQAIAEIRDLLRPGNPEIDTITADQLPGLVKRIIDDLQKPAAKPEDFTGAVRRVLITAQERTASLDFAGAAKELDDELAKAATEDQDRVRGRAALLAERGRVASLQLRYKEAAGFYETAANTAAFDNRVAWTNLVYAGLAYFAQGDEFGDNDALRTAITVYDRALNLAPRERAPRDWAATQNDLGNALTTLGHRESGTARLEEAVGAYRAVLQELTRERVPLDWAATQNNLGNVLQTLGEREIGTTRLEEAVAAYRAALGERTRERVPLQWAATQNNLGNALKKLGERESGTARLEEAVSVYRAALEERTRERVPLDWAMTQNNLGTALQVLGERESGTARLEEAVAVYRAALEERTRERVALGWAMTQNNLGNVFLSLGERESGTALLKKAVKAYTDALAVYEKADTGWDLSDIRHNRDRALALLKQRRK